MSDNLIKEADGDTIVGVEFILNSDKNVKLLMGVKQMKNKKYVENIMIAIDDKIVIKGFEDSILFKNELILFDKGDSQNKYLKIVKRKVEKNEVASLEFTLKNGKNIYFSKAECRAIVDLWNMKMSGHSYSRILQIDKQNSRDFINEAWFKYKYLV